jgi:DNA-binding NtrC family response regulator
VTRGSVLVVDDEVVFRSSLVRHLEDLGYEVGAAGDADSGLQMLLARSYEVVLTDLRMPGTDGIEFVRRVRKVDPDVLTIVLTAFGSTEQSLDAFDAGAFWFIDKERSQRVEIFGRLVEKALEHRRLRVRNVQLQRQLEARYGFANVIGRSESLSVTLELVRKVADTEATVLVLGESGVGKELIARALHFNSRRADQPFVPVNCGAIPEELLESELFGHVRGSFTGAFRDREGRFASADGGTLFLDEIGDMSSTLQTKLLRVLQEREFEPVGSSRTRRVDVRIVAATNQNLPALIREGRFREDLYFRLNVVPIEVAPLRERREDIPLLVKHFVDVQRRNYPEVEGISDGAVKRLTEHDWPGNVRELESLVERLVILKQSGWITEADLPPDVGGQPPELRRVALPEEGVDFTAVVEAFESDLIRQALDATSWNKKQAADLLNLKRTTLVEKIRSKAIEPNPNPDPDPDPEA